MFFFIFRLDKEKSALYNKESIHCSFKPQVGNSPDFEFKNKNKNHTILQNNKYYERINKAKKNNLTNIFTDYSARFDQRKKKENNTICLTEYE